MESNSVCPISVYNHEYNYNPNWTTRILTNLNHNYNKIWDILGTQEILRVFLLDVKIKCERVMARTVQLLGTLISNHATATKTSLKKRI